MRHFRLLIHSRFVDCSQSRGRVGEKVNKNRKLTAGHDRSVAHPIFETATWCRCLSTSDLRNSFSLNYIITTNVIKITKVKSRAADTWTRTLANYFLCECVSLSIGVLCKNSPAKCSLCECEIANRALMLNRDWSWFLTAHKHNNYCCLR